MESRFLSLLNMSFTGSYVAFIVILARLALFKAPKSISYMLWSVVGFRLICPVSLTSLFSLIPFRPTPIPQDIAIQTAPHVESGITVIDRVVSGVLLPPTPHSSVNPLQVVLFAASRIWLLVFLAMLTYGIWSMRRLEHDLSHAKLSPDGTYEACNLKTPLVIGFLNPRIYVPSGLEQEERRYILLHEKAHIERRDHIVKMLAYLILSLHWFNPLVWVAFALMSIDMEMSCDEKVLYELGSEIKGKYSLSLVKMASEAPIFSGSPLSFGEGNMKKRVKNVLGFKKYSKAIMVVSVALVVFLIIGLSMNRGGKDPLPDLAITTPRRSYSPLMSSMFGFELVFDRPSGATTYSYVCDKGSFCTYQDDIVTPVGKEITTQENIYWWPFDGAGEAHHVSNMGDTSITIAALNAHGENLAIGTAMIIGGDGFFRFVEGDERETWDPWNAGTTNHEIETTTESFTAEIPTGEPYSSAAVAARRYYRELGYPEGKITALRSLKTDYSGEPEILTQLKDETVTLSVEFSDDPPSHPIRTITLTREVDGKWEVIRHR